MPLEFQTADDPACRDGDREARSEVERGDLPAEEAEEQNERHLVDHRRRDEERERDAERHAGRDEPDEQRNGGAGAERSRDAENRRQHVAGSLPASGQESPRPLGREEAPENSDAEHDGGQKEEDLRRLEEEKFDRRAQVTAAREAGHVVREKCGNPRKLRIQEGRGGKGGGCQRPAEPRSRAQGVRRGSDNLGHRCAASVARIFAAFATADASFGRSILPSSRSARQS